VGADHVLLGSDYPFDMGDARHAHTIRTLALAPEVEGAILAGNAERLLGLERARREETMT
jgi:aminocarboxymuconate-semialdehyde decarboxylase